jgi:hypothetical protein
MDGAAWLDADDPRLPRAIRYCWELAARLTPVRFPAGVYKHRSIEELNACTDRWERASTPAAPGR